MDNSTQKSNFIAAAVCLFVLSCAPEKVVETSGEFKGKIARTYEESEEWWAEPVRAPKGAPNVLVFLFDDTGFAQFGSYGGLIDTPNIDRLAENGLRLNNFHTTALCSPSRAALLAGRNPHSIGLGSHSLTAMGFPGYDALVPKSAKSVAKVLQENGYITYALGKWDHTPPYEVSRMGPFHRWPSGDGFDHFYGFMAADAHQFNPVLWHDHTPVEPWRGRTDYMLDADLADQAIEFITGHKSVDPETPFMMYWATGSMHSPHQAPQEYIDKYKGRFDMGWDKAREMILERQKELGIVPASAVLTDRIKELPDWDSLPEQQKRLYAKQMEVFAAQLDFCDRQVGRIVDTLERIGELDNTLIFVAADNGASSEGGLSGSFNETYVLNGLQTPFDVNLKYLDRWGGPETYPNYHAAWGMAGNTPFRYFKQTVHRGGQHSPLIVHWPEGIQAGGEIRNQYHHIADMAPTILEAAGVPFMEEIDGVKQQPMDGISMLYAFDYADAPNRKKVQYYEMFGNRAIWADGWKAVSLHAHRMPWHMNVRQPFDQDAWELYHVAEDFSEAKNLAEENPEKLEEMIALFDEQALKYNVYPLHDDLVSRMANQQSRLFGDRKEFTYFSPGAVRIAEQASAPVKNRSHTIETRIHLRGNEKGVLVACGGLTGGYTMFIKDHKLYYEYNYADGVFYTLESSRLPNGPTDVRFNFVKTGDRKGTGNLYINGEKVDEVDMPQIHVATFSLSETFDLGRDTGTPVSPKYRDDFPFHGDLDRIVIRLTD